VRQALSLDKEAKLSSIDEIRFVVNGVALALESNTNPLFVEVLKTNVLLQRASLLPLRICIAANSKLCLLERVAIETMPGLEPCFFFRPITNSEQLAQFMLMKFFSSPFLAPVQMALHQDSWRTRNSKSVALLSMQLT